MENAVVVPVWRLVQVGLLWFMVGAIAGPVVAGVVVLRATDPQPAFPPPVAVPAGAHGTVVQFTALRQGVPVRCTLTMHGRTAAWSVTC